jgi:hypothetical protein
MAITISGSGADATAALSTLAIGSTLQAQVQADQTASIEALFSSLGLGSGASELV